ncbi:MAG: hypothetical protein KDB03_02995 [Planctomycetales bacterium]|nr:hypothetical protein [Planctomycetales bacterium]
MPNQANRVRQRRSTVGLDYGTHSTKAVYRVRGEELGQILYFDDEMDGYPRNASPSAIREKEGRLYFGKQALQMTGGTYYGSLKADLYNASREAPEIQEEIFVHAAAYLSWALNRLFESYPEIAAEEPILQISAPTSHSGPEDLVKKYLHIANAVHKIALGDAPQIRQGMEFEEVRRVLLPLLQSPLSDKGERRFFVMPETVAPIVSLQLEPFLEAGNYLIVDMGASTTEMSVFLVNDESVSHAANSILCYSDSTEFRGGNELERIQDLRVGASQAALEEFLDAVRRQADRVWSVGFAFDRQNRASHDRWKKIQVRLSGGGTLSDHVSSHFQKVIDPIKPWPKSETKRIFDRHSPATLECLRCEETDLSFYAVANGLSVERGRWPKFYDKATPLVASAVGEEPLVPSYLEIG